MATVKYDLGDILAWCKDGHCHATAVIVRWHTKDVYVEGINLKRYTDYDVFVKSEEKDDFELAHGVPECAFFHYKVVGHIDISGMSIKEIETELVYAIATVWNEHAIAYAVQEHWALMKLRKKEIYIPKMTDENCCYDGAISSRKKTGGLKKIGSQNDKIFALQKELDEQHDKYWSEHFRISKNLHKLGFTADAVCKIMCSELNDI